MVDYETYCQIRDHLGRQRLTVAQTARALGLHPRTVAKWAGADQFRARAGTPRASKLDAFKGQIVRWLDAHPYSAQQIFQRLGEAGYEGGISIVKDYVHRIRPRHREAFLKLDFAAGECAQVDWGEWGTIGVGSTRRRLSFFLMVLCYSRKRSGNPSFLSSLKLRISCLGDQRTRRGEHGATADGALPGTGGGISGIGSEGERVGRSQWGAAARAGELVRPFAALAGAA